MQYNARFGYVTLIVLSVSLSAYFLLIGPALSDLTHLLQQEEELTTQLNALKQMAAQLKSEKKALNPAKKTLVTMDKLAFFQLISGMANQQKVRISLLQWQAGLDARAEWMECRLVIIGEMDALTDFALNLMMQPNPVFIKNFSYHTTNGSLLQLDMQLTMAMSNAQLFYKTLPKVSRDFKQNPFCVPAYFSEKKQTLGEEMLLQAPLADLRMVGFFERGGEVSALVALPTGVNVLVSQGMVLGKERGNITAIAEDHLVVHVNNQQREIRM